MNHVHLDPRTAEHAPEACPAPHLADAPGDDVLATALAHVHRVAIVGASPNPSRTSYQIAVWLMENTPYELYLVNPAAVGEEIRGHGFYESLADLPVEVDLVNVFRRSEFTPAIAASAAEIRAKGLWLQLGVAHPEAMSLAQDAGMLAVQNRCIKVEYNRLAERIAAARVG